MTISLLYYERLGILLPAYVDPDSRYRYYAPEQLSSLDIILLCINLDIPLKELKQYQDENAYCQKKMLEDGRQIVGDKIRRLQTELSMIEYSLKCQEPQLPSEPQVMSVHMLVVIKNGEIADQTVGVQPKASIQALLD